MDRRGTGYPNMFSAVLDDRIDIVEQLYYLFASTTTTGSSSLSSTFEYSQPSSARSSVPKYNTHSVTDKEHVHSKFTDPVLTDRNDAGQTALHIAASNGSFHSVLSLLSKGASPFMHDYENYFLPLHNAMYHGQLGTILGLLFAPVLYPTLSNPGKPYASISSVSLPSSSSSLDHPHDTNSNSTVTNLLDDTHEYSLLYNVKRLQQWFLPIDTSIDNVSHSPSISRTTTTTPSSSFVVPLHFSSSPHPLHDKEGFTPLDLLLTKYTVQMNILLQQIKYTEKQLRNLAVSNLPDPSNDEYGNSPRKDHDSSVGSPKPSRSNAKNKHKTKHKQRGEKGPSSSPSLSSSTRPRTTSIGSTNSNSEKNVSHRGISSSSSSSSSSTQNHRQRRRTFSDLDQTSSEENEESSGNEDGGHQDGLFQRAQSLYMDQMDSKEDDTTNTNQVSSRSLFSTYPRNGSRPMEHGLLRERLQKQQLIDWADEYHLQEIIDYTRYLPPNIAYLEGLYYCSVTKSWKKDGSVSSSSSSSSSSTPTTGTNRRTYSLGNEHDSTDNPTAASSSSVKNRSSSSQFLLTQKPQYKEGNPSRPWLMVSPFQTLSHYSPQTTSSSSYLSSAWKTGMYSWGRSDYQLGYTSTADNQIVPRSITIPLRKDLYHNLNLEGFSYLQRNNVLASPRIVTVSPARYHTLILTEDGIPLTFGVGQNGRLGIGKTHYHSTGSSTESSSSSTNNERSPTSNESSTTDNSSTTTLVQIQPTVIPYFPQHRLIVTHISAGDRHSLAVTTDGNVYTWGDNRSGACGTGPGNVITNPNNNTVTIDLPSFIKLTPTRLDGSFRRTRAAKVYAGAYHSIILTATGEGYAFGSNWTGQLGLRDVPNGGTLALSTMPPVLGGIIGSTTGSTQKMKTNAASYHTSSSITSSTVATIGTIYTPPLLTHIVWYPKRMDPIPLRSSNYSGAVSDNNNVSGNSNNSSNSTGNNLFDIFDQDTATSTNTGTVITAIAVADTYTLALSTEGDVWVTGNLCSANMKNLSIWSRIHFDSLMADNDDAIQAYLQAANIVDQPPNIPVSRGTSNAGMDASDTLTRTGSGTSSTKKSKGKENKDTVSRTVSGSVVITTERKAVEHLSRLGFHVHATGADDPVTVTTTPGTSASSSTVNNNNNNGSNDTNVDSMNWTFSSNISRSKSNPSSGNYLNISNNISSTRSVAITQIAAGKYAAIARDVNGAVWVWTAKGREELLGQGQGGGGTVITSDSNTGTPAASSVKPDLSFWCAPKRIGSFVRANIRIASVSVSGSFAVAVCTNGSLYSWGTKNAAERGLLGHGRNGKASIPRRIQTMQQVMYAYAADTHTMVITGIYMPPLPPLRPSISDIALASLNVGEKISIGVYIPEMDKIVPVSSTKQTTNGKDPKPTSSEDSLASTGEQGDVFPSSSFSSFLPSVTPDTVMLSSLIRLYSPVVVDEVLASERVADVYKDVGAIHYEDGNNWYGKDPSSVPSSPSLRAFENNYDPSSLSLTIPIHELSSSLSSSSTSIPVSNVAVPTSSSRSSSTPPSPRIPHSSLDVLQSNTIYTPPSLRSLCERTLAQTVTLTSALSTLALAIDMQANGLAAYCGNFLVSNMPALLVYLYNQSRTKERERELEGFLTYGYGEGLQRWQFIPSNTLRRIHELEREKHGRITNYYKLLKRREYEIIRSTGTWRGNRWNQYQKRAVRDVYGRILYTLTDDYDDDTRNSSGTTVDKLSKAVDAVVVEDCMRTLHALFAGAKRTQDDKGDATSTNEDTVGNVGPRSPNVPPRTSPSSTGTRSRLRYSPSDNGTEETGKIEGSSSSTDGNSSFTDAHMSFERAYDAIMNANTPPNNNSNDTLGIPYPLLLSSSTGTTVPAHLRTKLLTDITPPAIQSSLDRLAANLTELHWGPGMKRIYLNNKINIPLTINTSMMDDGQALIRRTKGLRSKLLEMTELAVKASGGIPYVCVPTSIAHSESNVFVTMETEDYFTPVLIKLPTVKDDQWLKLMKRPLYAYELEMILPFIQSLHDLALYLLENTVNNAGNRMYSNGSSNVSSTSSSSSSSSSSSTADTYNERLQNLVDEANVECSEYKLLEQAGLTLQQFEQMRIHLQTSLRYNGTKINGKQIAKECTDVNTARQVVNTARLLDRSSLDSVMFSCIVGSKAVIGNDSALAKIYLRSSSSTATGATTERDEKGSTDTKKKKDQTIPTLSSVVSSVGSTNNNASSDTSISKTNKLVIPSSSVSSNSASFDPENNSVKTTPSTVKASPPTTPSLKNIMQNTVSTSSTLSPIIPPPNSSPLPNESSLWALIDKEQQHELRMKNTAASTPKTKGTGTLSSSTVSSPVVPVVSSSSPTVVPSSTASSTTPLSLRDILQAEEKASTVRKQEEQQKQKQKLSSIVTATHQEVAQELAKEALNARIRASLDVSSSSNSSLSPSTVVAGIGKITVNGGGSKSLSAVSPSFIATASTPKSLADIQREQEEDHQRLLHRTGGNRSNPSGGGTKNSWGLLSNSTGVSLNTIQAQAEEERKRKEEKEEEKRKRKEIENQKREQRKQQNPPPKK